MAIQRPRLVRLGFTLLMMLFFLGGAGASQDESSLERLQRLEEEALQAFNSGKWEEALGAGETALELSILLYGAEDIRTLDDRMLLGRVQYELGNPRKSEEVLRRTLGLAERWFGREHELTVTTMYALGSVLGYNGKLQEARELLTETLRFRRQVLGEIHTETVLARAALTQILIELGSHETEMANLEASVLELLDSDLSDDPLVLQIIVNYLRFTAHAMTSENKRLDAESWQGVFEILEFVEERLGQAHGQESIEIASALSAVVHVALAQGEFEAAQSMQERILAIHEALGLNGHPEQYLYFGNQASLYRARGDLAGARNALEQAYELAVEIFGPSGPRTAQVRVDLAAFLAATGEVDRAMNLLTEALDIEEPALRSVLLGGTEQEQRLFLRTFLDTTVLAISLHLEFAPDSERALRLAMQTVLRRKGIDLDIASLRSRLVGDRSLRAPREKLQRLRTLWTRGVMPGEVEEREVSWTEIQEAERQLVEALPTSVLPTISLEEVQESLGTDTALIEFVTLEPPDVIRNLNEPKRYVAYWLGSKGPPDSFDLGPAAVIDAAISDFQQALQNPASDVSRSAQALYNLTLGKMLSARCAPRRLIVAPDGDLLRVPFAALLDGDRFLIEKYAISYVTSGRDLVSGVHQPALPRERALLVANPDFGRADSQGGVFAALQPLPGTEEEAQEIGALLGLTPDRVLLGRRATEEAVQDLRGPAVLHLATHGFFLAEEEEAAAQREERSMVRSGLALSNIAWHRQRTPENDGFLSALELAQLDLQGTEIAVLSACQTGRGEILDGHGVFGLRRALVLAGARTQLTSLWKVDDLATADLMKSWYAQLLRNVPRGEAWHRTQRAALGNSRLPALGHRLRSAKPLPVTESEDGAKAVGRRLRHPFYWAAFILSGELGEVRGLNVTNQIGFQARQRRGHRTNSSATTHQKSLDG